MKLKLVPKFKPKADRTNLFVHVEEEFATTMFRNNQWTERFERIHQMPVPVM